VMNVPRRERNGKVAELRALPVFSELSTRRLKQIASNLDEVMLPPGEKLMTEGRSNDAFWIVLDGEVELTVAGRAHEVLKRGDIIGLPSMFTRLEANADVVTRTPVKALVASHAQFNGLRSDPEVELRFKAAMFDRLRDEVYQLTHETPKRGKGKTSH